MSATRGEAAALCAEWERPKRVGSGCIKLSWPGTTAGIIVVAERAESECSWRGVAFIKD